MSFTRLEGLSILINHLKKPQHTILIGARQLGKTTLVKQLVQHLEDKKELVYFLSFEDPTILNAVNEHPNNLFNFTFSPKSLQQNQQLFIVIDEVQYAANPGNFLKFIYDEYVGKVKLIVTGSSAFYIDKTFKDSLAGRKQVLELYPLGFDEFLHFKGEDKLVKELQQLQTRPEYIGTKQNQLLQLMNEYILYGGYPAVVLANTTNDKVDLLKELVSSYLKKDALEAGIREEIKFFNLCRLLADQVGDLVNQNQLSSTLQVSVGTIDNYLYLLQKSFIVQLISPKYSNLRKELTKMPKIYFNDTGLRNVLCNNFMNINDRPDKGNLFENAVYARLRKLYDIDLIKYWRTADGNEVDFIIEKNLHEGLAYEVKFTDSLFKPSKYKKFESGYPNFPLQVVSYVANNENTQKFIRL